MTKHYTTKKSLTAMMMPREMFPETLPDEILEVLPKIEVLLEYGHVKSAVEEIISWVSNTPEGMAYEYQDKTTGSTDTLYHNWTTWALFFNELHSLIKYDDKIQIKMKAFITRNLKDPETIYKKSALTYLSFIVEGDEDWIGSPLMQPNLSETSMHDLAQRKLDAMLTIQ